MYTRRLLVSCVSLAFMTSTFAQAVDTKAAAKATAQLSQKQNAPAVAEKATFSEAQLDQMLAPIALYPDTVLSHLLIAATYPLEIVKATRWLSQQGSKTSEQLLKAAENEGWDPSVRALVAFPNILTTLNNDLDWTQNVGDAFLVQPKAVMASVQRLREKAYARGSLKNQEHYTVERKEKVIVIEPRSPEIVYVPVYDTRYVYGDWWWRDYPPVYWNYPSSYRSSSYFYWGAGVRVAPGFYFSTVYWPRQEVIVVPAYRPSRYYRSHEIYYHEERRYWEHEPMHRRGVVYRDGYVPHRERERMRDHVNTEERFGNDRYDRRNDAQQRIEETQRGPLDAVRDRMRPHEGSGAPGRDASEPIRERLGDTVPEPVTPEPVTATPVAEEPSSPLESLHRQMKHEGQGHTGGIEVPTERNPTIDLPSIPSQQPETVIDRGMPEQITPVEPQPVFQEPMRSEPVFQEPVRSEPVYQEPMRNEPVYQEPVRSEPVYQEPIRNEPVYQEPVRSEPVYQEPMRNEPVYQPAPQIEPPRMDTGGDGRVVE